MAYLPYIELLEKEDLLEIVNFQCGYLPVVIKPEESYQHGYLPYVLTEKSLAAAKRIKLSFGVFAQKTFRPVGFVCGLSRNMARNVSYLEPLTREFPFPEDYPIFITLCVEKQYRRRSIGSKLMEQIIDSARDQQFPTAVVDTGVGSDTSYEFLNSHGFSQVHFPLLSDRKIFSKRLTPLPKKVPNFPNLLN